jgi:hypothetical protein
LLEGAAQTSLAGFIGMKNQPALAQRPPIAEKWRSTPEIHTNLAPTARISGPAVGLGCRAGVCVCVSLRRKLHPDEPRPLERSY